MIVNEISLVIQNKNDIRKLMADKKTKESSRLWNVYRFTEEKIMNQQDFIHGLLDYLLWNLQRNLGKSVILLIVN